MITAESTTEELRAAAPTLAIVPVGSIEQHAAHLPLGSDWLVADHVARAVGARLDAYVLPALPVSCSLEHLGRAGTVTLRVATLVAVIEDIVDSLAHHGFRRVVVLNGHGGNFVLKPAIRELNLRRDAPTTILVSTFMATDAEHDITSVQDRHAGDWETSVLLALDERFVRRPFSADSVPVGHGIEYCDYVPWEALTGNGVWGRPSRASRERGERYLRESIEHLVEYIPRTFAEVERLRRSLTNASLAAPEGRQT